MILSSETVPMMRRRCCWILCLNSEFRRCLAIWIPAGAVGLLLLCVGPSRRGVVWGLIRPFLTPHASALPNCWLSFRGPNTVTQEPLTPPDCDLRDYPWMPLDVRRLLTSETWVLGTAEEKVAAMTLWCEAWSQVPAGSLSADDRMLAHLSGAGANWKRIKDHVLRGWVLCADGRIYHPVVSEKANYSWKLKLAAKARTEAARAAREAKRRIVTENNTPPVTTSVTENVTEVVTNSVRDNVTRIVADTVTGSIRTEQNRTDLKKERKEERSPLPSVGPPQEPRGRRLPTDWTPGDDGWHFATELGLDPNGVLAKFRDYWASQPGQKGVKLDWPATWRNWCRHDAERPQNRHLQRKSAAEVLGVMPDDDWFNQRNFRGLPS